MTVSRNVISQFRKFNAPRFITGAEYNIYHDYYPYPRRQILNSSKMKQSTDHNFKFDENSRKLSKRVENTVGKGEIARYEQFLLFPQCFQKFFFSLGASNGVIEWEWVLCPMLYEKGGYYILVILYTEQDITFKTLSQTIPCFYVYK